MRHVVLEALVPGERAETVLDGISRFERYPRLAPHVRAAVVHTGPPAARGSSSWELYFRSGLLRWTETEEFDRERLRITFRQTDGDFDAFTGCWTLRQSGDDCALRFDAEFDFGIPSMEGILDPIAERVIKETVAWTVTGMFAGTTLGEEIGTAAPRARP
ncbi:type II toxin-antitoxin system RatA family toxin [Streptomyces poonensis]|uniref:Cyclase n=1 Tax=Streptomyces poonensis TaxID=68255 RepID=A0A918UR37_9ACTN|nr:SRPBCC family protein [Streptomyces poonensis]GGZ28501.1 cyclase [Streptomyces poonensis]GLJ93882.1 cyclase [Streptomyces poonensis]